MGCKLSIGIKGDNTNGRTPIDSKIMPVYHEQATSPIRNERKDSSTETLPVPKKDAGIQKNVDAEYIHKEAPDIDGAESKHSDSTDRWKSKARIIGSITGRRSGLKHRNRQQQGSK